MEIPKRTFYYINTNAKYSYNKNVNTIYLYLDNTSIDLDVLNFINQNRECEFVIYFKGSVQNFNKLLNYLTNNPTPRSVTIHPNVNVKKNTFLAIDDLPSNVKIFFTSSTNNNEDSLIEWVLNLSDRDFSIVERVIANEGNKIHLRKEREIAKIVFKHLSREVDFSHMSDTEKMNYMYDWVRRNIEFDFSLVDSNGFREGVDRTLGSDPVKVFSNKKGVCSGRSRLLRILTNNPYLKVNCFVTSGLINYGGDKEHEWNAFLDEHGQIFYYDLSFSKVRHVKDLSTHPNNYRISSEHFLIEEIKKKTPPDLPRRRILPLPPRKNQE